MNIAIKKYHIKDKIQVKKVLTLSFVMSNALNIFGMFENNILLLKFDVKVFNFSAIKKKSYTCVFQKFLFYSIIKHVQYTIFSAKLFGSTFVISRSVYTFTDLLNSFCRF